MLERYYRVMGWDPSTGQPSLGKLEELGLADSLDLQAPTDMPEV